MSRDSISPIIIFGKLQGSQILYENGPKSDFSNTTDNNIENRMSKTG